MPSVKNPNHPSKNRLAARRAASRKQQQRKSLAGQTKISKSDAAHGARPGLLPTSGPQAPLSAKKQKKLEQRVRLVKRRMAELEREANGEKGEVGMKGS